MGRKCRITWLFSIWLVLCMTLTLSNGTPRGAIAASPPLDSRGTKFDATKQPASLPENRKDAGNSEIVAGIDEAQAKSNPVREASDPGLSKAADQAPSGPSGIAAYIDLLEDNVDLFCRRIVEIYSGAEAAPRLFFEWVETLLAKGGSERFFRIFAAILGLLLAGIGSERFFKRYADGVSKRIISSGKASGTSRLILRSKSLMIDFLALPVFVAASAAVYFAFFNYSETTRWIFITYLAIVLIVRGVSLLSRFLLSPDDDSSRLVQLSSDSAISIHHWIARITAVGASGLLFGELLELLHVSEELDIVVQGLAGTIVLFMIIYPIFAYRHPVTATIFKDLSEEAPEATRARSLAASLWHIPAIIYLVLVWFFWLFYLVVGRADVVIPIVVTLGSVPLYWICNRLVQELFVSLAAALQKPGESMPLKEDEFRPEGDDTSEQKADCLLQERTPRGRLMPFLSRTLSISIAVVIFCWLLQLWGIFPNLGVAVMLAALKILLAISLAFVIWRWIELAIEKRVGKVQVVEEDAEDYGENEDDSGSRVITILQISRKFILIILFSVVGLIVLSAIGIDIKPLLAGAGVIGLAFGLGTQSLIKDIVSGMFFLVDDAFRIGDYVETGKIKGTVEGISIRSLRLRHPRGMIHTVPFSQLGSVTNFSRDYLVSKIDFRVPYGTDVDKVKKVVKKLNERVEQDEELGPSLLSPIKSIGVTGFDDSGLLMAVKFRSKPSRQSQLQRYVLKGLQESFGKHGLEFAHRHVVVRLPEATSSEKPDSSGMSPNNSAQPPPKEILSAGAAAAVALALAEDEAKEK